MSKPSAVQSRRAIVWPICFLHSAVLSVITSIVPSHELVRFIPARNTIFETFFFFFASALVHNVNTTNMIVDVQWQFNLAITWLFFKPTDQFDGARTKCCLSSDR